MKQNLIIAVLAIIAAAVGVYASLQKPATIKEYSFSDNNFMADIEDIRLPLATGGEKSLSAWKGKIIILNFWATWCPPCRKEIPSIIKMQTKWHDQNVQFVGLSTDGVDNVQQFINEYKFNYPNLLGTAYHINSTLSMGNKYAVLPFTVVIDPDFKIIFSHSGEINEALLKTALAQYNLK